MPGSHHLAQINVARMLHPLESPEMAGFVTQLEAINALAERSPGFIWRLQDETGDATAIQAFDDPLILLNMSVWATLEDLEAFTYRSGHLEPMRRRRSWFDRFGGPHLALWWVASGHRPSPDEGRARLKHLRDHGPSPLAFTFRHRFEPEAAVAA